MGHIRRVALLTFAVIAFAAHADAAEEAGLAGQRIDGYRGIWFTLGQVSEFGDKYSGGLGTYTANHVPIAVYAPKADKTFFVYGGTTAADERHLLCMAGWYDHKTGRVCKPVVVHDKLKVNDPHDNPAINIDEQGHVWVFVSGRARKRPGFKYRSRTPFSIDDFERVEQKEMTYPQLHIVPGKGLIHLFTKYTKGRELYWETSGDGGKTWGEERKLAGMGGHYQVSNVHGTRVGTTFMYHPGGSVDRRTNLYYMETPDFGKTWTTVDGKPIATPVADVKSLPLLIDYEAQKQNVYIHDLNFDAAGRPIILYLTSKGHQPGPQNGPYTWRVTHWTGETWSTHDVTTSDHNYDTGSLYVLGEEWRVVGPTGIGPQEHGAGGEMSAWTSRDRGATWQRAATLTKNSEFNHSYARRPRDARDPFFTFWADGHPGKLSPSRLYFANRAGDRVWQLPYDMTEDAGTPVEVKR